MNRLLKWFGQPPVDGPRATLLLRLMAGGVFLWEGILKFVYVNQGVGRFTKLGFPDPGLMAGFVGCFEIVGGILLLLGLMTRFVALPFMIEMIVAVLSTKISLYLGTYPLPLPPAPPVTGMWAVLHEVRSEYAQLLTSAFLLVEGAGVWSLDALMARKRRPAIGLAAGAAADAAEAAEVAEAAARTQPGRRRGPADVRLSRG